MKITEISKEEYEVGVINSVKTKYKAVRNKGKPYTFGFSYGAGEQKYGKELYEAYWTTYAKTKEYNEKIIDRVKKKGYLVSRYSGLRLLIPDIYAKNEFDRAKAERVATNFNIQSGNILTLYAIEKLQKWIEENNLENVVQIVNTIHDAIYLYIKNDPQLIVKINKKLIQFMVEDYNNGHYDDPIVKLEAELDIGHNMTDVTTLPNNCDEQCVKEHLKEL
jgi:DNA polymerase I-like protein with 3'-5' exonuclease and polymerase domains